MLSNEIIGHAIEVHRQLGPGLLESAYTACMAKELAGRRIASRQEVPLPLSYKGELLPFVYRLDLLVEDLVVVELKAVERLERIHQLQLLTYLRMSDRWLGLLINFSSDRSKHGLHRMLNG